MERGVEGGRASGLQLAPRDQANSLNASNFGGRRANAAAGRNSLTCAVARVETIPVPRQMLWTA